jgi:Zn-dependent protease with chaperone function/Zn-finger nucleic acid-binding protein
MNSKKKFARDFYEIQRKQWQKSLLLFLILFIFYFFLVGFVSFIFIISLGLFMPGISLFAGNSLQYFFLINLILSIVVAAFQFYDARFHGAKFIRKRLQAAVPDTNDRYHKKFINTIDEMRIAAGLPRVTPYIIPAFAINSMALIEADKNPSIVVTEGLLAEFTRDELQAVIAHELAHIIRGDTFYITLVCSLANFFERLREMAEPHDRPLGQIGRVQNTGGGNPLVYLATSISSLLMHLLSTLISRQRELLADATAVELNRNPAALARAIYKAHVKNSFIGDFNLSYSPLFIVPPESKGISDRLFSRIFNSHPPLMKRVRQLAEMVPTSPARIIDEVSEIRKRREKARSILHSREETSPAVQKPATLFDDIQSGDEGIWSVRNPNGKWMGPFSPVKPDRYNKCPRCRTTLKDTFYEGVSLKICPSCKGKLIDSSVINRIIARREVAFSDYLVKKAADFKKKFLQNPVRTRKINMKKSQDIFCPICGSKMLPRPFTYQYIIPVDKCFSCHKTWFDPDELEILQLLIEKH